VSREFRMPSLGAEMEAATLVQWRVKAGDVVHKGDIVAAVETEKGIIDIESFEDGVVEQLQVQPGTRVAVGAPLALFAGAPATGSEAPAAVPAEAAPAAAAGAVAAAVPAARPAPPPPTAGAGRGRRISPAARAHAAKLGVDLAQVRGSGPQGTVTLQDVAALAPAGKPPAAAGAAAPRAAMRHAIAVAMSRSKREIPHYYLQLALDFLPARSWLETYNAARPVPERLLPAVLLIKAAARAAAELPGFNGYFGAEGFQQARAVHAGVAIALRGGGLVAPAIMDAEQKPLATLMQELQALVGRVRAGRMRSGEFSSATITINSLGEEGVDTLFPIIQPPQVAIVGFGSVLERPWAVDGRIEARPVLNVTLAADHRVTDGRDGARFLARIRELLSQPAEL
jgi:pyruvate dehydrogenase E2 component (dihydrolipoamide acetyltransferase)